MTASKDGLPPIALVVDDDAIVQMEALAILEDAGFRTLAAGAAHEAVTLLDRHADEITLLFTDVEMPGGMNGFELARHTAHHWPDIGILVASGRLKPEPGVLPQGAVFIGKPFSAEVVHDHVARILPDGAKPETLKFRDG